MNVAKHAGTAYASVEMQRDKKPYASRCATAAADSIPRLFNYMPALSHLQARPFSIRERMKAFGGMLEVETGPGKGTSAVLLLPLEEDQVNETSGSLVYDQPVTVGQLWGHGRKPRPSEKHRLTVLLVDDHAMMREGLRSVLRRTRTFISSVKRLMAMKPSLWWTNSDPPSS